MITMNSKAQLTVDVIAKVAEGKLTITNATKLLSKSRRTVERYLQRYRKVGIQFIIHGNTGKAPANKTPDKLKQEVQRLIREKYYDLNLLHLADMLEANENIVVKRETLRRWAHDIHHVKRAKRRRSRVHKHRERMGASGLMLQMDGSPHRWFGNKKSCLIAAIDDATSELFAEFFPSETTAGCFKVMRTIIEKRGLFKTLYVDRAGIFGGSKRSNFSQMQRACEELGIEIIFASSPQGKGRIERAFDTLQDRLIPELRLNNIKDIAGANSYLQHVFIPQYWHKKLTVKSKALASEYKPLPAHINLDDICVAKVHRKIRNDHTFSYGNKFYFIESPIKHSIAHQKIEIRNVSNGKFDAYFAGRHLQISEVVEPTKAAMEDIEIQKKLDVLALADKLGNVTEASRLTGVSRDTIYRHRRLLKEGGIDALRRQETPNLRHKNRPDAELESLVIEFSLQNPHLGQVQVSRQLKAKYDVEISPNGVRLIWLRENMNTAALRLAKLELLPKSA
ncbi:ISNCY family transposase [Vibrio ostreicida]|uniref:ISNCY family transposase n=2 Tax=Vibrio ostreicida TaxID=526588 RepID=A0ABT8BRV5_9VIBR|nr:ISNCY family transposase [Vibrio ostreicida]MDN3608843.1 ISNCY family transposase [Vibrio ostreicida]